MHHAILGQPPQLHRRASKNRPRHPTYLFSGRLYYPARWVVNLKNKTRGQVQFGKCTHIPKHKQGNSQRGGRSLTAFFLFSLLFLTQTRFYPIHSIRQKQKREEKRGENELRCDTRFSIDRSPSLGVHPNPIDRSLLGDGNRWGGEGERTRNG